MRYWVYMDGEVPGSYAPSELAALPGFSGTTLVCPAEGEILEKNWRRAGEVPEIAPYLEKQRTSEGFLSPPAPPGSGVDALIDDASTRLFSHVTDLMKELENRREERALLLSLQRQLVDLKDQLQRARERAALLESRQPRIAELEETSRRAETRVRELEAALRGREQSLSDLRAEAEKSRSELEAARRRVSEMGSDLAIRNRLVDKLSRDLTDKELSLAKSLAVIRRLEEDLGRIFPAHVPAPEPPAAPQVRSAPEPEARDRAIGRGSAASEIRQEAAPSYTTDEPPLPPAVIEPPERPAAHKALLAFLKKFMPGRNQ